MSAQDDVAVLLRAVEKGGTVEERATVLVAKLRQTIAGMKNSITDPNALTALTVLDEAMAAASAAIVRAVVQTPIERLSVQGDMHESIEPEPWPDVEDEPEDEPEPEPPEPEPVPRKHKPVRRKR